VTESRIAENPLTAEFSFEELPDGIHLNWKNNEQKLSFVHSFSRDKYFRRISATNQALLKACNNRQRSIETVLDLTGGWGIDGFTLAYHDKQVTLIEQNEQVYSVLSRSLDNARKQECTENAVKRIKPLNINSLEYLNNLAQTFDCIYLDPMFPSHKSTAKPGKEMQLLQKLTTNLDIDACFEVALTKAKNRVVVKRPAKARLISELKPDLAYREKTVRFDVYLTSGNV